MSRKIDRIGLRCLVIALAFLSIMAAADKAQAVTFSPTGKVNTLLIFTKFAEEAPEDSLAPSWAQDIFNPDFPGSLTHYFQTMSSDVFTVSGSCLRKRYSSDHPTSHFTNANCGEFNWEILEKVDQDVDFGEYDNDGPDGVPNSGDDDGYVDFVFVNLRSMPYNFIYGPVTGTGRLKLSQQYVSNDSSGPNGHIRVRDGATLLSKTNLGSTVGYMAHEFGHSLGLDELADLSFVFHPEQPPEENSAGIGKWGMMGYGGLGWEEGDPPVPLCAYNLELLGWIGEDNDRLVVVQKSMSDVVIKPFFDGGDIYKIPLSEHEYFLVCNRQASACCYDEHIPESGLLIWHIVWQMMPRAKLDLECADGRWDDCGYPDGKVANPDSGEDNLDFWARDESYRLSHNGNRGDSTDVFDGVRFTEFGPTTNPSSKWETETFLSCIAITNIRWDGVNMVANFEIPEGVELDNLGIYDVWNGNGDHTANPGENIRLTFRFKNWSPEQVSFPKIRVSADDPYIYPDGGFAVDLLFKHDTEHGGFFFGYAPCSCQIDSSLLEDLWYIPYARSSYFCKVFELFCISSSCPEDHRIGLSLEVTDGVNTRRDTISFAITGTDEVSPEILSVDGAARVPAAGNPISIRALVREPGPLAAVEASIFKWPDSTLVATFPLTYEKTVSTGLGWRLYRGDWTAPTESDYWAEVVATDVSGNATGDMQRWWWDRTCWFTSKPFVKSADVLLHGWFWPEYEWEVAETVVKALEAAGIKYDLWNVSLRGSIDETTLKLYQGQNSAFIWNYRWNYRYDPLPQCERRVVGEFLANGGRLLVPTNTDTTFMRDYLYVRYDPSWKSHSSGVLKGVPGDPISDGIEQECESASWEVIYPLPPAVPIFTYASTGETIAIRVDTGVYRAIYLPYSLFRSLECSPTLTTIIRGTIDWLLSPCTGVEQEERSMLPTRVFRLQQNYPNPFNSVTLIRYQLASSGKTRLSIYNSLGQEVVQLVDAVQKPDTYSVLWDGKDKTGRDLASGVYLCKLKSGGLSVVCKMVLLR